ncbi:MAG: hypothetical protein J1F22_03950 [Lachnospiraceae bacterium]|nr:hypothetical protein [Lachnospiraceae bacterium]
MNKTTKNMLIITVLFIAAISLSACGTKIAESGDRAASDAGVSGSAADLKSDTVTLQISVGGDNKVKIPNPVNAKGEVAISLQEEFDYDDDISEKEEEKLFKKYKENLHADLSFAGFEKEVFVTSCAVGYLTKDSSVAKLRFESTGKEKTMNGNCLALHVVDGVESSYDDYDEFEKEKDYLLLIDYANKTFYKAETKFFLHGFTWWNDLKLTDLTGDGADELIIQHRYNKTIMLGVYRCDKERQGLKELYANWDSDDTEYFSGHLEDNYKVVLEYKDIGFSKTVSLLDVGYKERDLETRKYPDDFDDNWMVRLWKNKKLVKDEVDEDTVFLYTLDKVSVEKSDEGTPLLKLKRGVEVGHRSQTIGEMSTYLKYDKESDSLVLADAKFEAWTDK